MTLTWGCTPAQWRSLSLVDPASAARGGNGWGNSGFSTACPGSLLGTVGRLGHRGRRRALGDVADLARRRAEGRDDLRPGRRDDGLPPDLGRVRLRLQKRARRGPGRRDVPPVVPARIREVSGALGEPPPDPRAILGPDLLEHLPTFGGPIDPVVATHLAP
jgi:hypothetical protein